MTVAATHSHTQRGIAVIGDDTQPTKGQDPMSRAEIIETMARAICTAAGHHHWSELPADDAAAHHSGRNGGTWDCQSDYLEQAESALTALEAAGMAVVPREPTREMIEAGHMADERNYDGSTPIRLVWSAMLSAALPTRSE